MNTFSKKPIVLSLAVLLLTITNIPPINAQGNAGHYCEPTYSFWWWGEHIDKFSTTNGETNINNTEVRPREDGHPADEDEGYMPGAAYNDYYDTYTVSQYAGNSISFSETYYTPFYVTGQEHEFSIWIDYDNNQTFSSTEKVFTSSQLKKNHSGSFTIPSNLAPGNYRMRIRGSSDPMDDSSISPIGPCGSLEYGSAEDYKLTVLSACLPPSNLSVSNITPTSAVFSWTENNGSNSWNIEYGMDGFVQGNGTKVNGTTSNPYTLTGLSSGTDYDFYVQSNCGGDKSDWAGPITVNILEDPCASSEEIACVKTSYTATLKPNAGAWDTYTDVSNSYSGSEKVWSFIPPVTSVYTFELDPGTGNADFFLMDACSNTATNLSSGFWSGSTNQDVNLIGGSTYYIIADLASSETTSTTVSIGVNCSIALPVELIYFSAVCGKEVKLNWATASEFNSDRFIIEKSRDGETWRHVGEQMAAGNSNVKNNYSQIDEDNQEGTSYYLLRQIDFDGKEKIYGPISVRCDKSKDNIEVYPNPNNGSFKIEINSNQSYPTADLYLTNLLGEIITSQKVNIQKGATQVFINNLDLKKGSYLISIQKADLQLKPLKMIVN